MACYPALNNTFVSICETCLISEDFLCEIKFKFESAQSLQVRKDDQAFIFTVVSWHKSSALKMVALLGDRAVLHDFCQTTTKATLSTIRIH